MYNAVVKTFKATGAAGLVLELGFIPAFALVKNVTQGTEVQYMNQEDFLSKMAISGGLVTPEITDGEYIAVNGTLASDSKLKRTPVGTVGQVATSLEGLILDDIATVNDTANDDLVVIAFRGDR